jgi:hypothetical protein
MQKEIDGSSRGAKSPKLSHWGLVSGVPLETAVEGDVGRWWGGLYEVVMVVRVVHS